MNPNRKSRYTAICTLFLILSGCGGGGSKSKAFKVKPTRPIVPIVVTLGYTTSSVTYQANQPIIPNAARVQNGTLSRFTSVPNMPDGLLLNENSGSISGIPTAVTKRQTYIIKAIDQDNREVSTTLSIQVVAEKPTTFSYSNQEATYPQGDTIPPNTPIIEAGSLSEFTISPALPGSLSINANTGVISGVPNTPQRLTDYVVSARSSSGKPITARLSIVVKEVETSLPPPSELTYQIVAASYQKNTSIANNIPSISGGAVDEFSLSPALPQGLSLHPKTGIISGTPKNISEEIIYSVQARNISGTTNAEISIRVVDEPPKRITYSNISLTLPEDKQIPPMVPTTTGGNPLQFIVSPTLPRGLVFESSTGKISGSPEIAQSQKTYTIMAKNDSGQASTTLDLAIVSSGPPPPLQLSYTSPTSYYFYNRPIEPNTPNATGGPIKTYRITPPLPNGLTLNTQTGVISGTPKAFQDFRDFKVSAENESGHVSTNIKLSVSHPISCKEIQKLGLQIKKPFKNGIYTITPFKGQSVDVHCDFKTAGGGWTRIYEFVANNTPADPKALGNANQLADWIARRNGNKLLSHVLVYSPTHQHYMTYPVRSCRDAGFKCYHAYTNTVWQYNSNADLEYPYWPYVPGGIRYYPYQNENLHGTFPRRLLPWYASYPSGLRLDQETPGKPIYPGQKTKNPPFKCRKSYTAFFPSKYVSKKQYVSGESCDLSNGRYGYNGNYKPYKAMAPEIVYSDSFPNKLGPINKRYYRATDVWYYYVR